MKLGQEATVTFEDGTSLHGIILEYHERTPADDGPVLCSSVFALRIEARQLAPSVAAPSEPQLSAAEAPLSKQDVLTPAESKAILYAFDTKIGRSRDPKMIQAVRLLEDCVREGKTDWGEVLAAGVSMGLTEETLDAARLVLAGIGSDAFAKPVTEAPQNGGVTP